MENLPLISILLPVRNEERYIARGLNSIKQQTYPAELIEVIIADGMSNDNTRSIADEFRYILACTKIIDNPKISTPCAINLAIENAEGNILILMGGHSQLAPDYVQRCVEHLSKNDIDAVGGPIETIGETPIAKDIALAMSSPFGVGNSAFRTVKDKTMLVDTAAFAAYTREIIERVGPFNEELVRDQDDEYNYRLRKLGGKILLAEDIHSKYYSRNTLLSLWKQFYLYGFYKVRVLQKHPRQMSWRHFVPPTFIAALIGSALMTLYFPFSSVLFTMLVCFYLLSNLTATLLVMRQHNWRILPYLPIVFTNMHISYGVGFIAGLVIFANRWLDRE